ncbi:MAG TPA: hypothetical protein VG961_10450 [Ignavibacteria bacterium]|nr:hypothetical protein [Ignavibacteria bacterium]
MPVYIKKYRGGNYFNEREFIDSLTLDYIPSDGLPIFRFETEDAAGIGTYRAGDFDLNISLLQKDLSQNGSSIKDFFLGEERDFYYLVIINTGAQCFTGISQQSQIAADYTYSQNRWHVKLTCKDILIEWAKRCEAAANSTISFANGEQLTFEEYIIRHFAGLTGSVVLIELPVKTYLERLRELYSNIQWCYALGDYRNFITGQENISRWETFKELAKGLGFNFEMFLNPGTENMSEPEFIFKIFFITDLVNEPAITPEIIEITESITAPRLEWLFLKYRSFVFAEAEYADGIFFSKDAAYGSDTNHGDGTTLYPTCAVTFNNKLLSYINENQVTEKSVVRDIDFTEMPLKQYHYDFNAGILIGKLYPLDEALGGGMAYSRIFNCARVHGNIGDFYDFVPVQDNSILNHKKFLKGNQKTYDMKIKYSIDNSFKIWSLIELPNIGNFILNVINHIDVVNKIIEFEITKV